MSVILTEYTVTNLNDSGTGSLRAAVEAANLAGNSNTIMFDASLSGSTITLSSTLLLRADINIVGDINGDGKADITISGGDTTRLFYADATGIDANPVIDFFALNLVHGKAPLGESGGAIVTRTGVVLIIDNSTISDNHADLAGGAIFSEGSLRIVNSTLHDNDADSRGGAIYAAASSTLEMENVTITDNDGGELGGGVSVGSNVAARAINTTITGNRADHAGGVELASGATWTSTNAIIAGNTQQGGDSDLYHASGSTHIAGNSILGTGVQVDTNNGGNVLNTDSGIVSDLADNGGPVKTMAPLAPAVDKGTNALDTYDADYDLITGEVISVDSRGAARPPGLIDIGAHERIGGASFTSNITEDDALTVVNLALHNSLGSALVMAGGFGATTPTAIAPGTGPSGGTVIAGTYGSIRLYQDGYYIYTLNNNDADTNALEEGDTVTEVFTAKAVLGGDFDFSTITINIEGADDINVVNGGNKGDLIDGENGPKGQHTTNKIDLVDGRGGGDTIKALGGDDTVIGGDGKDQLDGGKGSDTVDYSDNIESILVDLGAVKNGFSTVEVFGAEKDLIKDFENVLGGKAMDNFTGDKKANLFDGGDGDDEIDGGGGDDVIDGGKGSNTLTGGKGDDQFWFTHKASRHDSDVITDFKVDEDTIVLDATIFAVLGSEVEAEELVVTKSVKVPKAKENDDHLLYNSKTGKLYFDIDGDGNKAALLIATFESPKPHLGIDSFEIV